jgi:hypothetical protein
MKNLHNEILEYLYYNDSGKYINLYEEFADKNITKKQIKKIVDDLSEYIEKESVYETRGILTLDDFSRTKKSTELNVRINQKGRERYEKIRNENKKIGINKKIALFTLLGVIITIIIFITPIIIDTYKDRNKVIPVISLIIDNKTNKEISVSNRQNFYLWFPGNPKHIIGKYKIINNNKSEIIKLPKGKTNISAKIINNDKFFKYFKAEEFTISFSIKYKNGLEISDEFLPFNKESLNKYFTKIIINK